MERRVLIIDDDRSMCEVLESELRRRDFDAAFETSPEEALRRLIDEDFGIVVTDINMQGMSGVELCKQIVANREDIPVVVMTAFGSMEAAVAAIRAGAYDFVTKPFEMDDLALTLERGLKHRQLREEVKRLRRAVTDQQRFDDIIGTSPAMKKMYDLVSRVAETETTVLVTGESGTGKELVAKALHMRSARKDGPFVAINCAAMPESLLESELFGHVKGAFTDARSSRSGLFVKASKGTLFLDEIGEMPAGMQAKLLRALQERTVRPVGGDIEVPFDSRLIAATNRDLETEVEEKRFREDLFYRINVVRIHVPPLRARGSDILLLAQHFLQRNQASGPQRVVGLKSAAADKLLSYPWPGNVRELQNCIERAVALAQFDHVGVDDLPERIREFKTSRITIESNDPAELLPMEEVERRYILRVLEAVGRKQDPGRSGARLRPPHALPQARALQGGRPGEEGAPFDASLTPAKAACQRHHTPVRTLRKALPSQALAAIRRTRDAYARHGALQGSAHGPLGGRAARPGGILAGRAERRHVADDALARVCPVVLPRAPGLRLAERRPLRHRRGESRASRPSKASSPQGPSALLLRGWRGARCPVPWPTNSRLLVSHPSRRASPGRGSRTARSSSAWSRTESARSSPRSCSRSPAVKRSRRRST